MALTVPGRRGTRPMRDCCRDRSQRRAKPQPATRKPPAPRGHIPRYAQQAFRLHRAPRRAWCDDRRARVHRGRSPPRAGDLETKGFTRDEVAKAWAMANDLAAVE